jgi:hypothetical protein
VRGRDPADHVGDARISSSSAGVNPNARNA